MLRINGFCGSLLDFLKNYCVEFYNIGSLCIGSTLIISKIPALASKGGKMLRNCAI